MKILYATVLTAPLREVIEGRDHISGLPGFYYPVKLLMERGHEVNFVILTHEHVKANVRAPWFPRDSIKALIRYVGVQEGPRRAVISKPLAYLRFMWATHNELKSGRYDFVYCKATEALGAQLVARMLGVPVGVRWFGDSMSETIDRHGVYGGAMRKPWHYLGLKSRCSFMIMTDDNPAKGHKYKAWLPKRSPYPLHIWKSGIEFKELSDLQPTIQTPSQPYIFCAARFDPVKRQDRVVEVLHVLHKRGQRLHLYLAGEVSNAQFFAKVKSLTERHGLTDYVHILGAVPNDDVRNLAKRAVANLFMYDQTLNLGNSFYETLSMGAIVVALDDGSLDDFIDHGVNGILVSDESGAADSISEVVSDKQFDDALRAKAYETARTRIESADARFGREVDLIESFAGGARQ